VVLTRTKRAFATTAVAAALAVGIGVPTASAQQQGLVNVEVSNVLNNNTIQITVPINAAANVCGVAVAVLAQELASGPVDCTAAANQRFLILGFA
jgi:uncharacterized protein HemY